MVLSVKSLLGRPEEKKEKPKGELRFDKEKKGYWHSFEKEEKKAEPESPEPELKEEVKEKPKKYKKKRK